MGAALRAGVIGAGILGGAYVEHLRKRPEVQVQAVADVRLEAAERLAAPVGAQAYADYRDMLAAQRLDLVIVATPDWLHREPTVAALAAGVPAIIQEKPLATTVEDAEAICEAVERQRARLFVNYANRASSLDVATHYVLRQGLLGPIAYGEARLDDNISVPRQLWGGRSQEWAQGSSTAHFLLPHVVDLLRWHFGPKEVKEVYAVSRREVLGYTPDVYDAFLTFEGGLLVRAKAEWIKHMDELVEFYMCFSGAAGTLIYNKRPGFGAAPGWRANLDASLPPEEVLRHQQVLLEYGVNVAALLHRPEPSIGQLAAGGGDLKPALEFRGPGSGELMSLVRYLLDGILQGTNTPTTWPHGPLPTHLDGLQQTRVTAAIVQSAETGRVVTL
ncbi:MAG: Gfo/Idh/MocA family protein [Anaerolineae bacterium]